MWDVKSMAYYSFNELWDAILEDTRGSVSDIGFKTWISELEPVAMEQGNTIVLSVRNAFINQNSINRRCSTIIHSIHCCENFNIMLFRYMLNNISHAIGSSANLRVILGNYKKNPHRRHLNYHLM